MAACGAGPVRIRDQGGAAVMVREARTGWRPRREAGRFRIESLKWEQMGYGVRERGGR